ncbi:Nucleic acid-binding, OB-fold [Sesbania bispinosa]|nr:Nucleic acid-binding, OB-fold [Sesbania bispinosa]
MATPSTKEIKVKDISNEIGYWVIKVKVLRLWPYFDSTNTDDMLSLEMILIDFEGTKINGSIAIEVLCATSFNLNEGGYYEIGRVEVIENDGLQRITNHPFKLVFWKKSFVKPWEPTPFSSFGLTPFTAFEITTYKNELNHLIDTVALCTSVSSESGQIECVLYDEYVDQLHDYLKSNGIQRQVVVFQLVRMMPFEPVLFGTFVIQVIPTVTKMDFNPPIIEVFDLYDWYNVKADVFDGVESRGFYLNDYHVINYLTKFASQSIGVHDPFECMIGTEFLFIVRKTCDHKVDQDGCFKAISFCGDAEILRILSERDRYLLDSWTKITMLTALKKICSIDDSFLKSNKANNKFECLFRRSCNRG